jgi:hypothetical protein
MLKILQLCHNLPSLKERARIPMILPAKLIFSAVSMLTMRMLQTTMKNAKNGLNKESAS